LVTDWRGHEVPKISTFLNLPLKGRTVHLGLTGEHPERLNTVP
jgi:hypothetical protein